MRIMVFTPAASLLFCGTTAFYRTFAGGATVGEYSGALLTRRSWPQQGFRRKVRNAMADGRTEGRALTGRGT